MKKVTVKNLRQGQTIYFVRSYCSNSYIDSVRIKVVDYLDPSDSYIVSEEGHAFYLSDLNIKNGGYSNHKCFYSRRRALTYLKTCLRRKYPEESDLKFNKGI